MSEILNRIRAAQVAAGEDAVMRQLAEIEGREYVDPKDAEVTRLRAELDAARATADEVYGRLMPEVERLRAALTMIADTPCPLHDEDAACELLARVVGSARSALSATPVTGQPEGTAQPEASAGVAETGPRKGDGSGDEKADMKHRHFKDHNGPHIPLTYGSAKSEVCACGAWRMVDHYDRPSRGWGWRTDSIEDAAKDDDER